MAKRREKDAAAGIRRSDYDREVEVRGGREQMDAAHLPADLVPLYRIYFRSPRNMNGQREPAHTLALMDETAKRIPRLRDPYFREALLAIYDAMDAITVEVRKARQES